MSSIIYIILYILYYIMSYHIISYHIIFCYITSCHQKNVKMVLKQTNCISSLGLWVSREGNVQACAGFLSSEHWRRNWPARRRHHEVRTESDVHLIHDALAAQKPWSVLENIFKPSLFPQKRLFTNSSAGKWKGHASGRWEIPHPIFNFRNGTVGWEKGRMRMETQ